MNTWACITARNEAATIGDLVAGLHEWGHVVVVVDDGSHDGTGTLARLEGAFVIWHEVSEGIGRSLMEAWRFALERGATRIAQLDAGGSHDPAELVRLLAAADMPGVDMVIGSRFMLGGGYHGRAWRAGCSRLVSMVLNMSQAGAWIRDWTSGYRVFSAEAAQALLAYEYGAKMHGWQIEVVARARQERLKVIEVPITYHAGPSSLNLVAVHEAVRTWLAVLNHMQVIG